MSSVLYEDIEKAFEYVPKPEVPNSIKLNLKHTLREYQEEALKNFVFYHSMSQKHKDLAHKHLLFHMATGSGKTDIIAGAILYLYEQGYRDFIFFVNTTNIITKTKENLHNVQSSKYLFKESIHIGDKEVRVNIIEDTFDESRSDDINILFSTINQLHINLETTIKENSITYNDFKDKKLVMIADEAHHLNASTKSQKESEQNWEQTTQNLLKINEENILLEFTATQDLSNEKLAQKYRDKIIYDYALKKFRDDGYSKEIKLISDNFDDTQRMLQAVIISEYRRVVAQNEMNLSMKPVVMFKSVKNTVDADAIFEKFVTVIETLKVEDIEKIFETSQLDVMKRIDSYIEDKEQLIRDIQYGFAKQNCLLIHSKVKDKDAKLQNLNSLEDEHNKIRAIFAVDILNEGWDVLNLFDIVKLDEAKKSKTSTTTSEAQLIGRGARYFPFSYDDNNIYKRKFDKEPNNPLKILEEMFFHSLNHSEYINAITKELRRIGLLDEKNDNRRTVTLKVKESFLNHELYKNGVIYVNRKIEQNRNEINGLEDYIGKYKSQKRKIDNQGHELMVYEDEVTELVFSKSCQFKMSELDVDLVRLALNQKPFFYFSNLKKYFPKLMSIREFIQSANYLGEVEFTFHTTKQFELSQEIYLKYILELLSYIEKQMLKNVKTYVGSCEFYPVRINQKIPKQKELKLKESDSPIHRVEDWYIFEPHNGTIEEMHFVEFIKANMTALKEHYSDIRLIRNEKAFDIFSFDRSQDGAKFEPDFILLLQDKEGCYHQIFCEPKGQHLFEFDAWKNRFLDDITKCTRERKLKLEDINDKGLELYENNCYKIFGLPFYNNDLESEFKEEFEGLLL